MRGCAIAASHAGTCQHDKLKHPAAVAKLESGVQLILIWLPSSGMSNTQKYSMTHAANAKQRRWGADATA
jgi:hypothetical protein